MKRPYLTVGLTMLCTMFLLFAIGALYTSILAAILLAVCGLIAFLQKRAAARMVLIGMAVLIAVSSFSYVQHGLADTAAMYCGENISVCGTLADYPARINNRFVYRLDNCMLGESQTSFSLYLSDEAYYECKPGDTVQFTALKIYPSAEKESKYYYSTMADGVFLRAYANDVRFTHTEQAQLRYLPKEIRQYMLRAIQTRLPTPLSGILSGLMLGNTDLLDTQTAAYFSTSGITHLFAVSGFHVSFWTSAFLNIFGRRKKHILPTLSACAFLFFFMALTGFSASVCRSGLMTSVLFSGTLFKRETDSLNSLGLALTVMLTQNPFAAADASLLLSAAATAAIILSSRPIEDYIITPLTQKIEKRFIRKAVAYISSLLCLSAAVTLALLPLTAVLFGSISLMTPLANVLCVPTAQAAMLLGIAAQLSHTIPYFSDFLFRLTELLLELLLFISKALASVPVAMFVLNTAFTIGWAVVSLVLIAVVYKKYDRLPRRAFIAALSCALSLIVLFNVCCLSQKGDAVLTVFDTGNASCITICDNSGNAAVIGCGGDAYTAEAVAKGLRSCGVSNPRLLLIPDDRETENKNAHRISSVLSPDIVLAKSSSAVTLENALLADSAQVTLWEDAALHFESTEHFRAAHLNINGQNIVICFYPSSDFTDADDIYKQGDVLICRQAIPPTADTSKFSRIILSSDKKKELYYFDSPLADKVITTADEGTIEITIQK